MIVEKWEKIPFNKMAEIKNDIKNINFVWECINGKESYKKHTLKDLLFYVDILKSHIVYRKKYQLEGKTKRYKIQKLDK